MTTPQDFQDRLLSFRGAAFGLEPVLTQSAWFRPHNRSEDIEGPLSRRRRHPSRAPDCPACCRPPAFSIPLSPMLSRWPESHAHILGRSRRLPRTAATAARAPSSPRPSSCRGVCASRPPRSTPSAAWPTMRSTSTAARSPRSTGCASASTASMQGRPLPFPSDRAFAETVARHAIPANAARSAARRARLGCARPPLRRPCGVDRLCHAGRRLRRRDDVGADGRARSAPGRARLRSRCRDAVHQHRARRRRGRAGRPALSAPAMAARRRHRSGCLAGASDLHAGAWRRGAPSACSRPTLLYARAGAGIAGLPLSCQPGIRAAGLLYAEIGKEVARRGFDSVSRARGRLRAAQAANC